MRMGQSETAGTGEGEQWYRGEIISGEMATEQKLRKANKANN